RKIRDPSRGAVATRGSGHFGVGPRSGQCKFRETMMPKIIAGGLDDPQVIRLLRIHLTNARAQTAPGSAHALDLSDLKSPEILFWSARDEGNLLAVGALK